MQTAGWIRFERFATWCGAMGMAFGAGSLVADEFPLPIEEGMVQLAEVPTDDFKECSGLVVSRQYPGVLWTHNDGTDRRLFAINRNGEKLAEFELNGALVLDFEDLALDDSHRLYLADIGDNLHVRPRINVFRVSEPDPSELVGKLRADARWSLRFPDRPVDAEAIFIRQEYGYLITKTEKDLKATLYRWSLASQDGVQTLERVGDLDIDSPVTGADLSADGSLLGVVAKDGGYVFSLTNGLDSVVSREPNRVKSKKGQIEGCAFDRDGLLAIAETRELFLFNASAFVPPAP